MAQRQIVRSQILRRKAVDKPALPDKRAESYLALAKDAAKRLTSAGLVWGVALLVSFVLIDSEVSKRLSEIRKNQSDIASLSQATEKATLDKKQGLQEKLAAAKSKQSDLGAPITFPLPGLTPVPISPPLAPALWLLIACLVVIHLSGVRRHAHGYLALALSHTPEDSRGTIVAAPYRALLAPLPKFDGRVVSAKDFANSYGVETGVGRRALVVILISCMVLLQLRMLWVQTTLDTHIKPPWLAPTLQITSLAVFGVTIALYWTWLRSRRVPDADFLPHGQYSAGRRELLLFGLGASSVVALGTTLPPRLKSEASVLKKFFNPVLAGIRLNPRFRQVARTPDIAIPLSDGSALNQSTGKVHLVSAGKLVGVGADRTKTTTFLRLSLQQLAEQLRTGSAQLRKSHASLIVARALTASHEVRRKPKANKGSTALTLDQEIALLMNAIRQDYAYKSKADRTVTFGSRRSSRRPSSRTNQGTHVSTDSVAVTIPNVAIHLYDRVASIAVAADRTDILKDLVDLMKSNKLEVAFSSRILKWSDPGSNWSKSIKATVGNS